MRKDKGYETSFSLQQLNLKRSIRLNRVLGSISSIRLKMNHLEIANAFDIDIADLRAPLDAEEMSLYYHRR